MISFWISVVPPKIAMTGVGSVDSRVSTEFMPFTKKIWPVTGSLSGAALARSPRRRASLLWWNGCEPFQPWSRYYSQVERRYPWRSDDGAVSLQEGRGDPR
jgi:hypothetical protein